MARKNSSVRRSNARGRIARGEARSRAAERYVAPPIEQTVIPDGTCTGGRKARFDTTEKAGRALKQAQNKREKLGSGHVERRYYDCPHCPGFHLTSRESYEGRS